jgi:hypothetical protein
VGNYEIHLGGGTLGALASWASPLPMDVTNSGTTIIDPAGYTVTLSGVLSGSGGLVVYQPDSLVCLLPLFPLHGFALSVGFWSWRCSGDMALFVPAKG